jgi:hypothetical protein
MEATGGPFEHLSRLGRAQRSDLVSAHVPFIHHLCPLPKAHLPTSHALEANSASCCFPPLPCTASALAHEFRLDRRFSFGSDGRSSRFDVSPADPKAGDDQAKAAPWSTVVDNDTDEVEEDSGPIGSGGIRLTPDLHVLGGTAQVPGSSLRLSLGMSNGLRGSPSTSDSDSLEEEDEDEHGYSGRPSSRLPPPPLRLFGSASAPLAANVAESALDVDKAPGRTDDTIGFLTILRSSSAIRADDRLRALLDEIGGTFLVRLDEASRSAEGRLRELDRLARIIDRLIEEGVTLGGLGYDNDLVRDGEARRPDDSESDGEYDRSPSPATPVVSHRPHVVEQSPIASLAFATPPPAGLPPLFPPRSPSSPTTAAIPPPTGSLVALALSDLGSRSLSLASALAAVSDQAQIGQSAAAESSRRVRALRTTMAQIRAEEEAVERAQREVERWETELLGRDDRAGSDGVAGQRAKAEMQSVQRAMEAFEVRLLRPWSGSCTFR